MMTKEEVEALINGLRNEIPDILKKLLDEVNDEKEKGFKKYKKESK